MVGSIGSHSTAKTGNAVTFKAVSVTERVSDASENQEAPGSQGGGMTFPRWPNNLQRAPVVLRSGIKYSPVRNWLTRRKAL